MKTKGIILSIILAVMLAFSLSACAPGSATPPDDGEIEITGFTVESDIVVESGQSVTVALPSVLDEYGNVLEVDFAITDKNGAVVTHQSGSFFALSEEGYTITYTVETSDEKTHEQKTAVHVIRKIKDEALRITRGEDYDLTSFYPRSIPGYSALATVERVGVTNTLIENAVEDKKLVTENLSEGYYLITITLDGKTDLEYATLFVDVEKSNLPVWNRANESAETYTRVGGSTHIIEGGATLETLTEADGLGKTGAFYKVNDKVAENTDIAFNLLPLHSKAYYAALTGYALTFDYYLSTDCYVGVCSNPAPVTAGWGRASVSFEKLVAVWDQLYGQNLSSDWGTVQKQNMFFVGNTDRDAYAYLGNFAIEYTGGRDTVTSVETSVLTTYDLTTLLGANDIAVMQSYSDRATIEWSLISPATEYTAEDGVVTLSEIECALYTATATAVFSNDEKLVIFEADIDFYDQTAEKTWNTVSADNLGYAWGYKTNASTAGGATVTVVNDPEGKTGAYFKLVNDASTVNENTHFNLIPLHDKAYYQSVADKCLMFDFFSLQSCYYDYDWSGGSKAHGGGASEWKTASVPVQTLLDNWDYIVGKATATQENQGMLFISGVHATRPTYLGNFRIDYDIPLLVAEEKTLDINGVNTYALTGLLSSDQLESYNEIKSLGTVTWSVANALNPEVTATVSANGDLNITSDLLYTAYTVSATLAIDGKDYPLVNGKLNLYNSTVTPVWNTVSEQTLPYVWAWGVGTSTDNKVEGAVSVVTDPKGREGKYYQLSSPQTGSDLRMHFNILPLELKERYQIAELEDQVLYFDFYLEPSAYYDYDWSSGQFGGPSVNTEAGWHTASVPVSTLLSNWNAIQGGWTNQDHACMFFVSGLTGTKYAYLGNFRFGYDVTPVSVTTTEKDINGATSFDLNELSFSDDLPQLSNATEKWTVTDIFGNQTELTNSTMDFTALALGDYTVKLTAEKSGATFELANGAVRFTDGVNPLPVWNEVTANTSATETFMKKGNDWLPLPDATVEVVTNLEGKTGAFLAIDDGTGTTNLGFNFLPRYGKDYYEAFAQQGKFALTFEYYIPIDGVWVGKASGTSNTTKGWYNGSITLDRLLEIFDSLKSSGHKDESLPMLTCNSGNADSQTEKIYIGNFEFVPVIEEIVSDTTSLVDIKDISTYSIRSLVNENSLETVSSLGGTVNYTVTNGVGASVTVTDGAIAATDGVYTVSVKATALGKEYNLYSGTIDLYNSTANPVWNTVSTDALGYAWGYKGTNATLTANHLPSSCITIATDPEGKTGNYYQVVSDLTSDTTVAVNVKPLHSKEYYQLYSDRILLFDVRIPGNAYYNWMGKATARDINPTAWANASVSVQTLLDNWNKIVSPVGNGETNTSMLYTTGVRSTIPTYIGNFRFGYSVTAVTVNQTVDLNGESSIDLDSLISSTAISGATEKWTVTDVFGNKTELTGGAFTGLQLGDYTVQKTLEIDGESYTAVSGTIRVVDSTLSPVWNTVTASTTISETYMRYCESYTELPNATIEIVTEAQGKTGNFIAIDDSVPDQTVLGFSFLARYAKDYYEGLVASTDYTYTLTFDYYAVSGYQGGASGEWGSKNAGWYTMEIPLETLVTKWALISSNTTNSPKDLMLSIAHNSVDGLNYAGNFTIVATPV